MVTLTNTVHLIEIYLGYNGWLCGYELYRKLQWSTNYSKRKLKWSGDLSEHQPQMYLQNNIQPPFFKRSTLKKDVSEFIIFDFTAISVLYIDIYLLMTSGKFAAASFKFVIRSSKISNLSTVLTCPNFL